MKKMLSVIRKFVCEAVILAAFTAPGGTLSPGEVLHRNIFPNAVVSTNVWMTVSNRTHTLIKETAVTEAPVRSVNGMTGDVVVITVETNAVKSLIESEVGGTNLLVHVDTLVTATNAIPRSYSLITDGTNAIRSDLSCTIAVPTFDGIMVVLEDILGNTVTTNLYEKQNESLTSFANANGSWSAISVSPYWTHTETFFSGDQHVLASKIGTPAPFVSYKEVFLNPTTGIRSGIVYMERHFEYDIQERKIATTNEVGIIVEDKTGGTSNIVHKADLGYYLPKTNLHDSAVLVMTNGISASAFTLNSKTNITIDLVIPTAVSAFLNDAGYLTGFTESDPTIGLTNGVIYAHGTSYNVPSAIASSQVDTLQTVTNVYATKTALTDGLAEKQDTIHDLTTIRSGAGLGATAVQPSGIADMATQTWIANQGFATVTWVLGRGYVTASVTNGTATVDWVVQQQYVDRSVTNGLASTAWVNGNGFAVQTNVASTYATKDEVDALKRMYGDSNSVTRVWAPDGTLLTDGTGVVWKVVRNGDSVSYSRMAHIVTNDVGYVSGGGSGPSELPSHALVATNGTIRTVGGTEIDYTTTGAVERIVSAARFTSISDGTNTITASGAWTNTVGTTEESEVGSYWMESDIRYDRTTFDTNMWKATSGEQLGDAIRYSSPNWEYGTWDGRSFNADGSIMGDRRQTNVTIEAFGIEFNFVKTMGVISTMTTVVTRVASILDIPTKASDIGAYSLSEGTILANAVAGKQDQLPYHTNAIPLSAVSGAVDANAVKSLIQSETGGTNNLTHGGLTAIPSNLIVPVQGYSEGGAITVKSSMGNASITVEGGHGGAYNGGRIFVGDNESSGDLAEVTIGTMPVRATVNALANTQALDHAAIATKQDALPFPTNAIPASVITGLSPSQITDGTNTVKATREVVKHALRTGYWMIRASGGTWHRLDPAETSYPWCEKDDIQNYCCFTSMVETDDGFYFVFGGSTVYYTSFGDYRSWSSSVGGYEYEGYYVPDTTLLATTNDVATAITSKQDRLPYETNAIPAGAIAGLSLIGDKITDGTNTVYSSRVYSRDGNAFEGIRVVVQSFYQRGSPLPHEIVATNFYARDNDAWTSFGNHLWLWDGSNWNFPTNLYVVDYEQQYTVNTQDGTPASNHVFWLTVNYSYDRSFVTNSANIFMTKFIKPNVPTMLALTNDIPVLASTSFTTNEQNGAERNGAWGLVGLALTNNHGRILLNETGTVSWVDRPRFSGMAFTTNLSEGAVAQGVWDINGLSLTNNYGRILRNDNGGVSWIEEQKHSAHSFTTNSSEGAATQGTWEIRGMEDEDNYGKLLLNDDGAVSWVARPDFSEKSFTTNSSEGAATQGTWEIRGMEDEDNYGKILLNENGVVSWTQRSLFSNNSFTTNTTAGASVQGVLDLIGIGQSGNYGKMLVNNNGVVGWENVGTNPVVNVPFCETTFTTNTLSGAHALGILDLYGINASTNFGKFLYNQNGNVAWTTTVSQVDERLFVLTNQTKTSSGTTKTYDSPVVTLNGWDDVGKRMAFITHSTTGTLEYVEHDTNALECADIQVTENGESKTKQALTIKGMNVSANYGKFLKNESGVVTWAGIPQGGVNLTVGGVSHPAVTNISFDTKSDSSVQFEVESASSGAATIKIGVYYK